ncbi:hypothetical protein Clacol_005695 [Clathrus columnatus]|uniref:Major facilitator superfamily (MFS) profile domain-containing protein n=1 Tax=Clathrus columnatus TaxID=1419009 RepID=A0AAV5AA16_9AGAM|nr:hypothetical protein Clacol_005695 [Clathrus columnatus]
MAPSRSSIDGYILTSEPHDVIDPRIEDEEVYQVTENVVQSGKQFSNRFIDGDVEKNFSKTQQSDDEASEKTSGPIYVEFSEGDPRNPMNKSRLSKWITTWMACTFTILSGFGITPLFTAPLSEELGRRPLFITSMIIFAVMHIMVAEAQNMSTVIVARVLAGAAGSTGATVAAGVVADIWAPYDRGVPMSIYALTAAGSTGLAPTFAGLIEQNPHLQWRWIQWLHLIVGGVYALAVIIFFQETRAGVILTREAKKLRRETGNLQYRARVEDENSSLWRLITISCTRPLYMLSSEPIVMSISLWVGVGWGIVYSQLESIGLVFSTLYHFDSAEVGLAFLPLFFGCVIGFIGNFYQDRLYVRNVDRKGPEARLYAPMLAAIVLPIGCFIYAWTAIPSVHAWIAPMCGLLVFMTAVFTIYLASFTYLADCYNIYASSALAAQSLFRNSMATMYNRLTFHWASTLFGCIAAVLAVVPFMLYRYGPWIRSKSKIAQRLLEAEQMKK